MDAGSGARSTPLSLGVLLISIAVLALQVLQTRVLSVQMWHHHSYMVVTMTLLGFAAAGSIVTVWPALVARAHVTLPWSGILFSVSTIAGYLILAETADNAARFTEQGQYLTLSIFYSYLLIPYLFGGLVVTIALSAAKDVHRLYFFNLVGSAIGAWVFIGTITYFGAERLLVICAAVGPLAALAFLGRRHCAPVEGRTSGLVGAVVALGLCAVLFVRGEDWLHIEVASNKIETVTLEQVEGSELLETRWSPLCRLDLVKVPGPDDGKGQINIFQDGDAITVMMSDAAFEKEPFFSLNTFTYLPHYLRAERGEPGPKALVIGVGGGIDIRHALRQKSRSVLGIEINATTVDLVGNDYREFNNGIYWRPGVDVVIGEGRSTLRRLDETFDVIQLSGTDTYTASNSGAYVLAESYLYTSEALREYLEHLTPQGTLGVIRLGYDPPRENLRLFGMALIQLREMGAARPSDHAVVIYNEVYNEFAKDTIRFASCVFSREPMPAEAIALFKNANAHDQSYRTAYYPGMAADGNESEFSRLAAAIEAGTEAEFYASYPWRIQPVTDDSPFFFNYHTLADVVFPREQRGDTEYYSLTGGPIGMEMLGSLLLQTSILVAVLILLPLLVLRRGGLGAPNAGRHLTYFLALGAAFMFLEISTIQRLVLFLGHPTYSLSVTLCCFLLFAGLGSLFARRFDARPAWALRRIVPILAIWILVFAVGLDYVLDPFLSLPLAGRIAVVVALLAPMNFLMGMPFPLGLTRLHQLAPQRVPWAFGANGGASVIGSILCIVLAMETGFRVISVLALLVYVGGMLVFTTGPLAPRRAG